jgi:hypothetical protein
MTLEDFIAAAQPATDWSPYLTALWYERHGDWNRAHEIVQDIETKEAAHIHAYLHRREGDLSNARYWYGQAGQPAEIRLPMDEEWERLALSFLCQS